MMIKSIVALSILYCFTQPCRFVYYKGNSFFDSLTPLSFTFAASVAKIHESHLEGWVDFKQLDPSRVKIIGSFVELTGPVWIAPSVQKIEEFKVSLTIATAFTGAAAGFILSEILKLKTTTKEEKQIIIPSSVSIAIGLVAGAALGLLAWTQLSKVIPKTAGIFFHNRSSFR
jgi:hypothetical protein